MAAKRFKDIYFTTRDGLKLYGRHYPARVPSNRRPVLCLPGLTRNSRDFERVAEALAGDPDTPRDVYTMDSRGRGNSEHARDWRDYVVPIEMHTPEQIHKATRDYEEGKFEAAVLQSL